MQKTINALNTYWSGKHAKIIVDELGDTVAGWIDHFEWEIPSDYYETDKMPKLKLILASSDENQDDLINVIDLKYFAISEIHD